MVAIGVKPLHSAQLPVACRVLADAFTDEPAYQNLFPDVRRRRTFLRHFVSAPVRAALAHQTCWTAMDRDAVIGVAAWQPPGQYPWPWLRQLRAAPALLPAMWLRPTALPRIAAFGSNVDRAFPDEPVWYLQVVGVRPGAQGGGVGTRLLQPGLARADADRRACYLETASAAAVRFYQRLGFVVEDDAAQLLPNGPTHWTMRRPTQPG